VASKLFFTEIGGFLLFFNPEKESFFCKKRLSLAICEFFLLTSAKDECYN